MNSRAASVAPILFALLAGCVPHGGALPAAGAATVVSGARIAPAVAGSGQWLQQGMNPAHTGYNSAETTLGIHNVASLAQLWSFPTGAQITAPILIANGVAYVNSADGYLYAVNATTGAQIWKFQTYSGGGSQDDPAVAGGHVYVGCLVGGSAQQNGICAVKTSNGHLAWSYFEDCNCTPPEALSASPVVSGSTVLIPYFSTYNYGSSRLIAVTASSGTVLWQYQYKGGNSGGPSASAPAVANGNVYIGRGFDGAVCSLTLAAGSVNWCSPTADGGNSVAVAKGVVYDDTSSHGVFAFDATSGTQLWQYTPTAGNYSGQDDPPAIANGKAYVSGVGSNGNLYALKAATGALLFDTQSAGSSAYTYSSPSIANGVAYVECQSSICAFNAKNGALLYAGTSGPSSQSSPAVVNGVVYDTCGPNTACAYALPAQRQVLR